VVLGAIFLSKYRNDKNVGVGESITSLSNTKSPSASPQYYAVDVVRPDSFFFDPNVADSTQLLRLGLAPFQVRSIYRYRAKGGRFSTKDDFRRVYRLTNEQWERLSPLIRIDRRYQLVDVQQNTPRTYSPRNERASVADATAKSPNEIVDSALPAPMSRPAYPIKLTGDETVDINTADSILLCRIPGIGPYFARKIVQYRRRLGGYVSTSQLLEIEDFPADAIAWMVVEDTAVVSKLAVNRLSTRKLMKHPYMGYYRAQDIADYSRVHGPIRDAETLKTLPHFTQEDIQRLLPYLSFE
jgi:DNA uptake protein ComE-like DNA-binding protein